MNLLPGRHRQISRGQALVEFALILPLALLILMGIVQFGLLFASQIAEVNAVRETARFGSTSLVSDGATASTNGANICVYLRDKAMTNVPGYAKTQVVYSGATYVTYSTYADPHAGAPTYSVSLKIYIAYKSRLVVPLVSDLIDALDGSTDGAFRLSATETMRVENPVLKTNPAVNTTVSCVVSP